MCYFNMIDTFFLVKESVLTCIWGPIERGPIKLSFLNTLFKKVRVTPFAIYFENWNGRWIDKDLACIEEIELGEIRPYMFEPLENETESRNCSDTESESDEEQDEPINLSGTDPEN